MKNGKLRVALVGVSFGAEFIPIYLKHPDVDSLVLVDTNEKLLNTVGDKFLLEERLTDFNAMLENHRRRPSGNTACYSCSPIYTGDERWKALCLYHSDGNEYR